MYIQQLFSTRTDLILEYLYFNYAVNMSYVSYILKMPRKYEKDEIKFEQNDL